MTTVDPSKLASLRHKLAATNLPPYRLLDGREKAWQDSSAGTDHSLERFLRARKGDVQKAETMFTEHLIWRRRCFPIHREGTVAQILDEKNRFQVVCSSGDGRTVLMMHFQWGYFYRDGVKAEDCLRAALWFAETEIVKTEEAGAHDAYILLYGGPPPLDFAMPLQKIMEANYPERLYRAVIYPVPTMVARVVKMMCWFLDKDTANKLSIEASEEVLLKIMDIRVEQLPAFVRGGLAVTEGQMERDSPQRMTSILREAIFGGKKGAVEEVMNNILRPLHELVPATAEPPTRKSFCLCWLDCCVGREEERKPHETILRELPESRAISPRELKDSKTSKTAEPNWCLIIFGFITLNLTLVLLLHSMFELWRCASADGTCKPLTMSLFEDVFGLTEDQHEL